MTSAQVWVDSSSMAQGGSIGPLLAQPVRGRLFHSTVRR